MDLGQMVMSRVQASRGVQLKCHALLDIVWILTPFKVPYPGLLRGAWKTQSPEPESTEWNWKTLQIKKHKARNSINM